MSAEMRAAATATAKTKATEVLFPLVAVASASVVLPDHSRKKANRAARRIVAPGEPRVAQREDTEDLGTGVVVALVPGSSLHEPPQHPLEEGVGFVVVVEQFCGEEEEEEEEEEEAQHVVDSAQSPEAVSPQQPPFWSGDGVALVLGVVATAVAVVETPTGPSSTETT